MIDKAGDRRSKFGVCVLESNRIESTQYVEQKKLTLFKKKVAGLVVCQIVSSFVELQLIHSFTCMHEDDDNTYMETLFLLL